jgi:uncharacterized protein YbaP (TraB family)
MRKIILCVVIFVLPSLCLGAKISLEDIEQQLGLNLSDDFRKEAAPLLRVYNKGKYPKSIAVAMGTGTQVVIGIATDAQSELAASFLAGQQCEKYCEEQSIEADCEIVVSGDIVSPLGVVLRRGLVAETPSLVWKVQGENGLVYLAGSVHILKATLFPIAEAYNLAYDASDQIAFEVNPLLQSDPERIQAIQLLAVADSKAVKQSLGKDTRKKLKRFLKKQNGNVSATYKLQPAITSMQIVQIRTGALGYVNNLGLEMHFARHASSTGKAVLELESPIEALKLFTDLSLDDQAIMLQNTLDNLDSSHEVLFELVSSWLHGDAEKLYALTVADMDAHPVLGDLSVQILDDRNTQWMDKIQGYLVADKTTLVMVGAAHMAGKNGLLAQLENSGHSPVRLDRSGQTMSETAP